MKTAIQKYGGEQTRILLRRLAFRANRAARVGDAEAIHDLRVAIRRFAQALRSFRDFFPKAHVRKIRRQLRRVMNAAAEARNRDIALQLVAKSRVAPTAVLTRKLQEARETARRDLLDELRRWNRRDFSRRWRAQLGL